MVTARVAAVLVIAGVVGLVRPAAQPAAAPSADLLLVNGRVYTLDPARPWAEAIAISGSRIAAVGTSAEV